MSFVNMVAHRKVEKLRLWGPRPDLDEFMRYAMMPNALMPEGSYTPLLTVAIGPDDDPEKPGYFAAAISAFDQAQMVLTFPADELYAALVWIEQNHEQIPTLAFAKSGGRRIGWWLWDEENGDG